MTGGKALVLCAGRGTRLGALTRERPKALLPLGGRPLLAWTLAHLARHGFRDVAVNLHHRAAMIREAIGDGARFGQRIHYEEEPAPLGTAGAVRNLAAWFGDVAEVLVVYGDVLFEADLAAMLRFHRERAADATLLVHRRARSNSVVELASDGRVTRFLERPPAEPRARVRSPWTNSGIQILARDLVARIPAGRPADLPRDVYVPYAGTLRLYALPCTGYRCAIDSPARYRAAQRAVAQGELRTALPRPTAA